VKHDFLDIWIIFPTPPSLLQFNVWNSRYNICSRTHQVHIIALLYGILSFPVYITSQAGLYGAFEKVGMMGGWEMGADTPSWTPKRQNTFELYCSSFFFFFVDIAHHVLSEAQAQFRYALWTCSNVDIVTHAIWIMCRTFYYMSPKFLQFIYFAIAAKVLVPLT
jgi:hypothetical protein